MGSAHNTCQNKVSKIIGIMYQTRKYLNKKNWVGLYNTYIYSYLIYCVESGGNVANVSP